LNAQEISRTIRSRRPGKPGRAEKLFVIESFSFSDLLIYSKGKFIAKGGEEVYYILISSKISLEG
jgi:hypothetical protein